MFNKNVNFNLNNWYAYLMPLYHLDSIKLLRSELEKIKEIPFNIKYGGFAL